MNPHAHSAQSCAAGPMSGMAPLWPDPALAPHPGSSGGDSPGFCEALEGLQVRELHNLDLFHLLFGSLR